jgi:multidrug efflux pump
MSLSSPFIRRPVATTLLTVGIFISGVLGFTKLPVSPLPQVDFPVIMVQAQLPGASPNTVATSVAEPLERHLGQIADVNEMSSTSSLGQTRIILQFDLSRNIDGAARDVQAAINAAHADLPAALRSNPIYRKLNPSDAPVLILALSSKTLSRGRLYDVASNVFQQRLSQLSGVGQVMIGGAALPAVRVELNPMALFNYGVGLEDIRAALASANANSPKGAIEDNGVHYQVYTNDQASKAADYRPLIVGYRNGNPIHLSDLGEIVDSVEDLRNEGLANGEPAVLVIIFRQPGANIIDTVDSVKAELPALEAALPRDVKVTLASDRSLTIRASLHDTEWTLVIAVLLVTFIVFVFLGDPRAALIPAVAVPVSIVGTFGVMYLLGFSLDTLSLMALTIATGFVVDDAIVVLENITRYLEAGVPRFQAALRGASEVGFTVLSISVSLIAVFSPILLMGGLIGRFFREFALTLSIAVLVSLVISLTTTPMLCSLILKAPAERTAERSRWHPFTLFLEFYERSLGWALRHSGTVMLTLVGAVALTIVLFAIVPKGFFPQQDTGRLVGSIQADQSISFQAMEKKMAQLMAIVQADPAVQSVVGFIGSGSGGGPGSSTNTGSVYVALKSLTQRNVSSDQVIERLRRKLTSIPGALLFLQSVQDFRAGGRSSAAQFQYSLEGDSSEELNEWTPKLVAALQKSKVLTDVNSDLQQAGLETFVQIDRDTAARLSVTPYQIDNTLYDAYGQRQVSTIYSAINQYHVVMEVAPRYWQDPSSLRGIFVSTSGGNASGTQTSSLPSGTVAATSSSSSSTSSTSASSSSSSSTSSSSSSTSSEVNTARDASTNAITATGHGGTSSGSAVSTSVETMIPLVAFAHFKHGHTPLSVNHSGLFVSSTISFNLKPGASLGAATTEIEKAVREIGLPADIHGSSQGTAAIFQASSASEPLLIAAALAAVYIVLGVLYESYIHPITILSTLPSAGVGSLLALLLFRMDFSIIALIGVILLIGIVKKNAIMMVDFAIAARRDEGMNARDAIFQACILRFRPIMMTTAAAILGAVPLALSFGEGGEIRRPLGISIVGGLIISQMLTLYTTPVLYLLLDRVQEMFSRSRRGLPPRAAPSPAE